MAAHMVSPERPCNRNWLFLELPVTDYRKALDLQNRIMAVKNSGRLNRDVLILLEHTPVFTLGKRGGRRHLNVSESFLMEKNVPVIRTERGGLITYHGPGQIMAYPIIDLKAAGLSVAAYVMILEQIMIKTAASHRVRAERNETNRGIWVGPNKIGSVGIRVRRNISMHGLALNVSLDLTPFSWIDPCGINRAGITSLAKESVEDVSVADVKDSMARHFQCLFKTVLEPVSHDALQKIINNGSTAQPPVRSTDAACFNN